MNVFLTALHGVMAWLFSAVALSKKSARDRVFLNVITADAGRIADLQADLTDIAEKIKAIIIDADEAKRDLDDEEMAEIDKLDARADRVKKQIKARSAVSGVTGAGRSNGRRSSSVIDDDHGADDAVTARGSRANVRRERSSVPATPVDPAERRTHGFQSFGEFAVMAQRAGIGERVANERFAAVATTYGNEGTGADGGFLVPAEFRDGIWKKVNGEDGLMNRCAEFVTGRNSVTMPKDETTPWDTAGGIQAYWEGEGGVLTQTKPSFQTDTMRLDKLTALVPVTDELLEDAPGLESYLNIKAPEKMNAKINTAIYRGNGVGKPLGVMESGSLVTVAKKAGQAADTVVFENISAIWSRMWAASRRNAIWVINQDIEPQLDQLAFPAGTSAAPIYMPAGGLSASPFATLKGRPVLPIEPASTLGNTGDIALVDFSQYMVLKKAGEIRSDVSMHLLFDQDMQVFRFIFRMTGKPMWSAPIAPENGTSTRSWAVTLEDRA